jgi:hypothetical protein
MEEKKERKSTERNIFIASLLFITDFFSYSSILSFSFVGFLYRLAVRFDRQMERGNEVGRAAKRPKREKFIFLTTG